MPRKPVDNEYECGRLAAGQQPFGGACPCCRIAALIEAHCQQDRGINYRPRIITITVGILFRNIKFFKGKTNI